MSSSKEDALNVVLKEDGKDDSDASGSTNQIEKVIGLLGVPGFLINILGRQGLVKIRRQYPRLFKFLTPLIVFISATTAFTYLLYPAFTKLVGDWLPYVKLKSDDPLYDYLCRWAHYRRRFRQLELEAQSTRYKRQNRHDSVWWPSDHEGSRELCYSRGSQDWFFFQGTLFIMEGVPNSGRRHYYDTSQDIKLKALSFSHAPIKKILSLAWDTYQSEEASRNTRIWHFQDDCWDHLAFRRVRPLDTVDIDENEKSKLIKDMTTYLSDDTKLWYGSRGIPYRRGYLFHGPPGTGKTSLSVALAGHFNCDLYLLSLANPKLNDSVLASLMTQIDTPAVLLLEDVDSAGLTRETASITTDRAPVTVVENEEGDVSPDKMGRLTERVAKSSVTLSGVLNALDGAASPEGHVLLLSTNAPENLDPAMARAGRVDCKVEFKNASSTTAKNIFKRMMGDEGSPVDEKLASEFARKIPEGEFSPAEIQGYLLNYIRNVKSAMAGLDQWVQETTEEKAEAQKKKDEEKAAREARMKPSP